MSKSTYVFILFLATLVTGFFLSRLGKPLNTIAFNLHKLIALGFVILVGIYVYQTLGARFLVVFKNIFLVSGIISVIGLFVSGALMSIGNGSYGLFLKTHWVTTITLTIVLIITWLTKILNK